jgi:hypothetical protein
MARERFELDLIEDAAVRGRARPRTLRGIELVDRRARDEPARERQPVDRAQYNEDAADRRLAVAGELRQRRVELPVAGDAEGQRITPLAGGLNQVGRYLQRLGGIAGEGLRPVHLGHGKDIHLGMGAAAS